MIVRTRYYQPGTVEIDGEAERLIVAVTLTVDGDRERLSFSGVEGPRPNGDCAGSCGQTRIPAELSISEHWTAEQVDKLRELWDRWHLNDMRAGCEHQRAMDWGKQPIDPTKPLNTYGKHCGPGGPTTWNMLVWVSEREHPEGLLSKPCPVCGYRYGSAWLQEDIPTHVKTDLAELPEGPPPCKAWRE